MDNSALAVAIREQLVAELSKSAKVKPYTASIGVVTDDCNKENNIVREGILLELTKHNNPSRRGVKDASIQTDEEESAANNHAGNDTKIEQRLMEIEHECEQRLRREMNGKLRLSAKQQAMQAHTRLERKHKDECRSLQKQLVEERSRSKHREKELLQAISQQQMSWQKELKKIEQKLEKSMLEKSTLESEMGLLNDRMKEFQITRFNDNEKSERALTMSLKDLEQQKRQFQIGVAEAVRERDRFQLMLANESELLVQKTKQFEQTQEELLKKLVNAERKLDKTESALNAKNSEFTALRALLKQCQSALESLSYKDESGPNRNVFIPQISTQQAARVTLTPTIPILPNQSTVQEQQAIVQTVNAQASQNNIIDEKQPNRIDETRVATRNNQFVEKKHLGDPPPCTLLGDPPEEVLSLTQPLVQSVKELDSISVEAIVPKEIELDSYRYHDDSITEESALPVHKEQVKFEDTSQSQPDGTESTDNEPCTPKGDERNEVLLENDGKKLSTETYPSFNNEAETNKTTSRDETSIAVRDDESSAVNNDSSSGSESSDDEYSMSFCTLDQKLDKQGRVSFIHIK
eukprot:scaffold13205_cov113-Skeletonema_dohrnii-CCMP3373.AAC.9